MVITTKTSYMIYINPFFVRKISNISNENFTSCKNAIGNECYNRHMESAIDIIDLLEFYKADYLNKLDNTAYNMMYKEPMLFNSLLQYAKIETLKELNATRVQPKKRLCEVYTEDDMILFSRIAENLVNTCFSFNSTVSLFRLSIYTGIPQYKFSRWNENNNQLINECENVNVLEYKVEFLKEFKSICEGSLFSMVSDKNSIGSMFILKSKYGYIEKSEKTLTVQTDKLQASEIARLYTGSDLEKPPNKPLIDSD